MFKITSSELIKIVKTLNSTKNKEERKQLSKDLINKYDLTNFKEWKKKE